MRFTAGPLSQGLTSSRFPLNYRLYWQGGFTHNCDLQVWSSIPKYGSTNPSTSGNTISFKSQQSFFFRLFSLFFLVLLSNAVLSTMSVFFLLIITYFGHKATNLDIFCPRVSTIVQLPQVGANADYRSSRALLTSFNLVYSGFCYGGEYAKQPSQLFDYRLDTVRPVILLSPAALLYTGSIENILLSSYSTNQILRSNAITLLNFQTLHHYSYSGVSKLKTCGVVTGWTVTRFEVFKLFFVDTTNSVSARVGVANKSSYSSVLELDITVNTNSAYSVVQLPPMNLIIPTIKPNLCTNVFKPSRLL